MNKTPAICGGTPIRNNKLQYAKQWVDEDDICAVAECLRQDYLTTGPHVREFEERLTACTGTKYAVAVANGTAALHIACLAAGIGSGDEVIVSPITFAASANCVLYCGGKPVFADIDAETLLLNPRAVEKAVTKHTKAVIPVHFQGTVCDMDEIGAIAMGYGLTVIGDAAHALGSKYKGKSVGAVADMTEFSFHPVKTITTGEGGAITTDSEELYKRLNLFRTHGITRQKELLGDKNRGAWYYEQIALGYNYRITDIQCALGVSQLKKLDAFAKRRKELVKKYDEAFSKCDQIKTQKVSDADNTVRHLYTIQLCPERISCDRRLFFDALNAEGIGANVHYIPVYLMPYYQSIGYRKGLCPNAEAYYANAVTIPLFPAMTDNDQQDVIDAVFKLANYYKK